MNTTTTAGITIRERALQELDVNRDAEAAIMVPNAERAFATFFGEAIDGEYRPTDGKWSSAVTFDIGDGYSVWYMRQSRKGSHGKTGRRETVWWFMATCEAKKCTAPVPFREISKMADLGRALEVIDDVLCDAHREEHDPA